MSSIFEVLEKLKENIQSKLENDNNFIEENEISLDKADRLSSAISLRATLISCNIKDDDIASIYLSLKKDQKLEKNINKKI